MATKNGQGKRFTRAQKEAAFQVWYRMGRPAFLKVSVELSQNPEFGYVSNAAIGYWAKQFGWEMRADELDAEAQAQTERDMIQERADMIKRHKSVARLLLTKGVAFIKDNEVTSDHAAMRAIESAVAMERQAVGLPEIQIALERMTDEAIERFIAEQKAAMEDDNPEGFEDNVISQLKK
jgi:hypothetical protein